MPLEGAALGSRPREGVAVTARPGCFDSFLFADYSGAAAAAGQRRAITLWRLQRGGRARRLSGPFTRESLRACLLDALRAASAEGRRVLFGIDHQWSWPLDMWRAAGLAELPWRSALARLIHGGDRGQPAPAAGSVRRPARPALAADPAGFPAAFNAWLGEAVFYCPLPTLARRQGLPTRSGFRGEARRRAEQLLRRTSPANRLGGIGAVAGQTLHGLVELQALLEDAARDGVPVQAWPQDGLVDDGRSHIGVEVYPSLYRPAGVRKSDDADARACCLWAARAPLARLLDLRTAPAHIRRAARLEGWILGVPPGEAIMGLAAEEEP
jgi:hypothetical protein